jgi:glutamyl-Q tRNA(Asp) synthetase
MVVWLARGQRSHPWCIRFSATNLSPLKPSTPRRIPPVAGAAAYRGRFAPSPTGPLHAGSLAAALASWLDARAHGGAWIVRIEDVDPPREVPGASREIVRTLARFGLESDEPVVFQSRRGALYEDAFARLRAAGLVYACSCSRKDVEAASQAARVKPGVYPGICRERPAQERARAAWRVRVPDATVAFDDRAYGRYAQRLARDVGDFVVRRADGPWAYQLAVVVDDAAQGITDVVRGADLLDNTPRQIFLQHALGLPTPRYLHVPVVTNAGGEKLSKQTGARALTDDVRGELERAGQHLGLPRIGADTREAFLACAIELWRERRVAGPTITVEEQARG